MTIGWETLDVGEQALVYNHEGSARIEDGPKRIFLWRERFSRLSRFAADQKQYLAVRYKDGRVEHKKGPCVMFMNPIAHDFIVNMPMMSLDANEALVVYRQDEQTKEVTRYIQFGPTLYMLKSNEWLHSFSWHGTDPKNKTNIIPDADQFQVLKVIPDQFYYNVDEVRLKDDAAIKVKLMLFYELKDIDIMLNATKDPIADFVNCLCADVVAFASRFTYIEFMEKASQLNETDNYPQLMERCKSIGYTVSKVVYRGYHAHDKLQRLHDNAVQTRTNLKLAYEKEVQEQALIDMKLHNEKDRTELEHKMEIQALEHKFSLEEEAVRHSLGLELQNEEEKDKLSRQDQDAEIMAKQMENEHKLQHYKELHKLSVDLNQFLTIQTGRPEKIIKVVTDNTSANYHLHHK